MRIKNFYSFAARFQGLLTSLLLILPLAANADEPTKVGVLIPLTGDFARYGERIRSSLEKFESPTLRFLYEDEGCEPGRAVTAFKKLSSLDRVRIFLGPWCGSPQSAVAPFLPGIKGVSLLGSSAPENVFGLSKGRMFSTHHSIERESQFNAEKISARGVKRTAILFLDNQFSRAHEDAFRKFFPGEIVETIAYTSADPSQLKSIALRVKGMSLDAVYMPDAYPLLQGFAKELSQIGAGSLPIYAVYGTQFPDILTVVPNTTKLFYSYDDIGEREALDVFPAEAGSILSKAVSTCGEDDQCILKLFRANYPFDQNGVIQGKLVLKTIRNGKFVAE